MPADCALSQPLAVPCLRVLPPLVVPASLRCFSFLSLLVLSFSLSIPQGAAAGGRVCACACGTALPSCSDTCGSAHPHPRLHHQQQQQRIAGCPFSSSLFRSRSLFRPPAERAHMCKVTHESAHMRASAPRRVGVCLRVRTMLSAALPPRLLPYFFSSFLVC